MPCRPLPVRSVASRRAGAFGPLLGAAFALLAGVHDARAAEVASDGAPPHRFGAPAFGVIEEELELLHGPSSELTPASLGPDAVPPASRYGALERAACEAELERRHVPYERVAEARGVLAPVRLTGPLAGVTFRSNLPAMQRRTSPYEIYDCRLVLALADFARVLARHDVVEVVHYSVYRPPPARVRLASGAGRRHQGGLAIDAAQFTTSDGRTLSVEKDFHGFIGARTCPGDPPEGRAPKRQPGADARAARAGRPLATWSELRRIVCEAADAQLFNVLLTPDYNWQHRNHFHLEVTAGVRWVLVR